MKKIVLILCLSSFNVFAFNVSEQDIVDNLLLSDKALNSYISTVESTKGVKCQLMKELTSVYPFSNGALGFTTSFECYNAMNELIFDYLVKGDIFSKTDFVSTRITTL